MWPTVKEVVVTNVSDKTLTIYPRFPRPKKETGPAPYGPIILPPGSTSKPLPYSVVTGSKGWDKMMDARALELRVYDAPAPVVKVKSTSDKPITLSIPVSEGKGKRKKKRELVVQPRKVSRSLYIETPEQRHALLKLQRQRQIQIAPIPHIIPIERDYGSYGDDRVYSCDECGGPIVFRGRPPRPIHV